MGIKMNIFMIFETNAHIKVMTIDINMYDEYNADNKNRPYNFVNGFFVRKIASKRSIKQIDFIILCDIIYHANTM